jgi:transcriptional regulator with XRE-family HTH domain
MNSKTKEKYLEFKRRKSTKVSTYVGLSDDIALSIINALKKANISKTEFAKKVGKDTSVVSKWLNGQHNFTIKTIVDIENALNQKIVYPTIKINKEDLINRPVLIMNFDFLNKNAFSKVNRVKSNSGKMITLSNSYTEQPINLDC